LFSLCGLLKLFSVFQRIRKEDRCFFSLRFLCGLLKLFRVSPKNKKRRRLFFSVGILAPRPPIPARKYRQSLYLAHREKNDQEKGRTIAVIAVSARGRMPTTEKTMDFFIIFALRLPNFRPTKYLEIIRNNEIIAKNSK
jgi:hypothetical protein